jgi:diguanylate cyclase (GGDEF)-like protein
VVERLAYKREADNQRNYAESLQESGAIITTISDLSEVIDQFLFRVNRFASYDNALLLLFDDRQIESIFEKGIFNRKLDQTSIIGHSIASLPLLFQKIIQTKQPAIIKEIALEIDSTEPFSFSKSGSAMCIPMELHGSPIGLLWVENPSGAPYNENQLLRINAFINQTVVAIQNARLFGEVALALKREERLNEIAYLISSSNDLTDILTKVTRLAAELTGASASEIILIDTARDDYSPIILNNLPEQLTNQAFNKNGSHVGHTYENNRPLIVNEYSVESRAINEYVSCGVKSALFIPVATSETRLGVLALYSFTSDHAFSTRTAGFVQAIGQQTALALQNARYLDSARKRAQEAETLREAAAAVASSLDQEEAIDAILIQLKRVVPYDSAAIFVLNDGKFEQLGGKGGDIKQESLIANDGPGKEIIENHQPVIIFEPDKFLGVNVNPSQININTWLGIPLLYQNLLTGILSLSSITENAYDQDHIRLAAAFADQAAITIENVRLFQETKRLATTDGLTGVNNRRYFFEIATLEFERSKRYSRPLSVIMLDIDNFKNVNDQFGHRSGDMVLKLVAEGILSSVRAVDIVGRYGGEEFAIFLPEILTTGARHMAERIRLKIANEEIDIDGEKIRITASLGIAGLDKSPITSLDKMLHRADIALYAAKKAGRNRVSL